MNWYKKAQQKRLFVMRGCPGSGKSTLAKQLGQGGVVLGSDDFFMINGTYQFDPNMLSDAHLWNQGRVLSAMKKGITPIVVDNTNTQSWEMKPYVEMAQKYGYDCRWSI
jgi:NEDD4-binding protein 2